MREKQNKISVLLSSAEFDRFESFCKAKGHKKSTLVARLIREHLDANGFRPRPPRELPFTAEGAQE